MLTDYRSHNLDTVEPENNIVFFDGECGFCDTSVRWIMAIDDAKALQFAPLQGETAARLLPKDLRLEENLKTIVYLAPDNERYLKSDAVIEILSQVGGFWKACRIGKLLPTGFRNWFYDRIAERRRSLISKASCPIPNADQQARLLP